MTPDLRDFWRRFQSGIDISVATTGELPDKILGVRDGVRRYFSGLERLLPEPGLSFPVRAHPQIVDAGGEVLPITDSEILSLARSRARQLDLSPETEPSNDRTAESSEPRGDKPGATFAIAVEAGISTVATDGEARHFVRSWAVVRGLDDEAWGSSGALQLPQPLIDGLDSEDVPFAIPGTRRSGGMLASLTRGTETRREATALATFYALTSLLYGRVVGSHP